MTTENNPEAESPFASEELDDASDDVIVFEVRANIRTNKLGVRAKASPSQKLAMINSVIPGIINEVAGMEQSVAMFQMAMLQSENPIPGIGMPAPSPGLILPAGVGKIMGPGGKIH